ncbi:hypothetical protein LPJ57_000435 [Coemansia sp. RSA 486]|nr:hypothetical protein LPJ57_000435 [Coemansia sp. RSA 486]
MELRDGGGSQTANTAELIKMIRKASEALDQGMAVANVDYFAPHLETLRTDILELFRRLLIRNPYSSYRKDVASKLWFRTIYPSIEQYRANIKQFETMLSWPATAPRGTGNGGQQGSSDAGGSSSGADAIAVRRELSKWRARFQKFLQASAGSLLRVVAELAESNELVAARSLSRLSDFATDYRALAVHAYGFEFVDGLRSELHPTLNAGQRAALAIISRLLIYLGDLSRYRILYTSKKQSITEMVRTVSSGQPQQNPGAAASASSSPSLAVAQHDLWWPAKNFYRGASRLAPHRGQAYNQLAVVHGYEKNSLDGVFSYYRALTALMSFMPAEANLKTILENALRAIDDGAGVHGGDNDKSSNNAGGLGAHAGYLYYEHRVYQKFTHLRYLFAVHQPTARERADLLETGRAAERVVITADMERQLASDITSASARFVLGVKTGSVSQRHALVAQGIHIFELQRLSALSADDSEIALHSPTVTRLSAQLTMGVAQGLCAFISGSIADALRDASRVRSIKSESDLLSNACRRALPAVLQTLVWLVSVCVRVVRDSTTRDYLVAHGAPVSVLRRLVFEAVRECGLLASVSELKTMMDQVRSKVNRRALGAAGAAATADRAMLSSWQSTIQSGSTASLARQLWSAGGSANDTSEGSLRLEEELFVGWRLPDGTVWGKQPEDNNQQAVGGAVDQSFESLRTGGGGSEDGFQVRWQQLLCLLNVVSECVPSVMSIIDSISAPVDSGGKPTKGAKNMVNHNHNDGDDGEEEVGEEETICFHGRPVPFAGIKQGQQQQQQQSIAASPMVPESIIQSIPPTPDIRKNGKSIFRTQADKQETEETPIPPTTVMANLDLGSLSTSLSLLPHPQPPPLLATSVSFSGSERPRLVDKEKDEVVSPAMIASTD